MKINFFKNVNKNKLVIVFLVVIEMSLIFLSIKSYGNKNLDKYILGANTKINKNMMAILLETNSEEYEKTNLDTFPAFPYIYNDELSTCMDSNGELIEGAIEYNAEERKASVSVSKTSKCYFYFRKPKEVTDSMKEKVLASNELWNSGLEGDGLRYIGSGAYNSDTTPSNFICFGTSSKEECKANEGKYMYRIIGTFPDENKRQHLKLIKFNQIENNLYSSDRN